MDKTPTHKTLAVDIDGVVVIGEGERDEAPMLFIGEEVGKGGVKVDIALDPLECTNSVAFGRPNALTIVAAADRGNFLHAPDTYMEKIAVGSYAKDVIDLNEPPEENLKRIGKAEPESVLEPLRGPHWGYRRKARHTQAVLLAAPVRR